MRPGSSLASDSAARAFLQPATTCTRQVRRTERVCVGGTPPDPPDDVQQHQEASATATATNASQAQEFEAGVLDAFISVPFDCAACRAAHRANVTHLRGIDVETSGISLGVATGTLLGAVLQPHIATKVWVANRRGC